MPAKTANRALAAPALGHIVGQTVLLLDKKLLRILEMRAERPEVPSQIGHKRYIKVTPILVSVRQTARQGRRTPSSTTSKLIGIPYVVETCRHAPVSERLRTEHSSFGALSLRMICALFNTRLRMSVRLSCTVRGLESTEP